MMKLLITSVTWHMPQSRVSNTIMHVTLNTTNGVVRVCDYDILKFILIFFILSAIMLCGNFSIGNYLLTLRIFLSPLPEE